MRLRLPKLLNIPSNAHIAYGALVEQKAVCSGIAMAYKMLLDMAGVPNLLISGTSAGGAHMWNLVYIDNQWLHVDVTWNGVRHKYFALTEQEIRKDTYLQF
jgi:transglutaminase/protease-like cytokinesis protein 3